MSYQKDFIIYDTHHESVYVTGNWCNWDEKRFPLTKIPNLYFIASVPVPFGEKIQYKYIIDGHWQTNPKEETETDAAGNVNNVFRVPKQEEVQAPLVGSTSSTNAEPIVATSQPAPVGGDVVAREPVPASSAAPSAPTGSQEGMVTGVEKVAPGVVEATAGGSGVSEKDLAKPELPVSPSDKSSQSPTAASAAPLAAIAPVAAAAAVQSHATSTTHAQTEERAAGGVPLAAVGPVAAAAAVASHATTASNIGGNDLRPAPTADAPLAPASAAKQPEGQGLFTVLGHIGSQAVHAVQHTAENIVHKVEDLQGSPKSGAAGGAELPKTATQTPAPGLVGGQASHPTVPSGATVAQEIKAHPTVPGEQQNHKEPADALKTISTGDTTDNITKEIATVDLNKTKEEVVHAVERFGAAIAGGLGSLGVAHEGRVEPVAAGDAAAANAAKTIQTTGGLSLNTGSAVSTPGVNATTGSFAAGGQSTSNAAARAASADAAPAPSLPPVSGMSIYPADGSAPAPVTVAEPKGALETVKDEVKGATTATGSTGAAAASGQQQPKKESSSFTDKLKKKVAGASSSKHDKETSAASATSASPSTTTTTTNNAAVPATAAPPAAATTTANKDAKLPPVPTAASTTAPATNSTAAATATAPTTAAVAAPPASTVSKKDTAALGVGHAPSASTTGAAAATNNNSGTTPATTNAQTAPSTPSSANQADRKRKSSFFAKVKHALSSHK